MDVSHIFVLLLVVCAAVCLIAMEVHSRRNARAASASGQAQSTVNPAQPMPPLK